MIVLVCGGRYYSDLDLLDSLDFIHSTTPITKIIQGGAMGADLMAKCWAHLRKIPFDQYNADWDNHGKAAGPIRNKKMMDEGNPDVVVAAKGGHGTQNMVKISFDNGCEVIKIGW